LVRRVKNVNTSTACHPANDHHHLRIPAAASPWNSGYLIIAGDSHGVALTVEGILEG
jgi:hypothetical protein